jgi:hypothetical protein
MQQRTNEGVARRRPTGQWLERKISGKKGMDWEVGREDGRGVVEGAGAGAGNWAEMAHAFSTPHLSSRCETGATQSHLRNGTTKNGSVEPAAESAPAVRGTYLPEPDAFAVDVWLSHSPCPLVQLPH